MKKIQLPIVLLAVMLSSGCVPLPSLNPLWDETHLAMLPELEGVWTDEEGDEALEFTAGEKSSYRLTYWSKDEASRYEVHVVRLGGWFFLDIYPDEDVLEERLKGEAYMPLIPTHFFGRIRLEGDSLELALLDDEALHNKVEQGEADVHLVTWEDGVLLTSDTPAIQQMMVLFADDEKLWDEPEVFVRVPARP